jgi:hypothetical protein
VRSFWLPEETRRGHDEDEPAVALRFHRPECRLAQVEAAIEVHVEHALPVGGRELVEAHRLEDARVAHDRIDATEPVDCCTHDRLPAVRDRNRVVRCDSDATRALDFIDDLVGNAGV